MLIGVVGDKGCLPKGTLIKTPKGLKPIEDITEVLSYNFRDRIIENKPARSFNSGNKKIVKIYTEKGLILCSYDHKWPIFRNNIKRIIKTENLRESDELIWLSA